MNDDLTRAEQFADDLHHQCAPLIDPDCRDGKCDSCVGGPCEHDCHKAGA